MAPDALQPPSPVFIATRIWLVTVLDAHLDTAATDLGKPSSRTTDPLTFHSLSSHMTTSFKSTAAPSGAYARHVPRMACHTLEQSPFPVHRPMNPEHDPPRCSLSRLLPLAFPISATNLMEAIEFGNHAPAPVRRFYPSSPLSGFRRLVTHRFERSPRVVCRSPYHIRSFPSPSRPSHPPHRLDLDSPLPVHRRHVPSIASPPPLTSRSTPGGGSIHTPSRKQSLALPVQDSLRPFDDGTTMILQHGTKATHETYKASSRWALEPCGVLRLEISGDLGALGASWVF